MGDKTPIAWTDATWSPVTGCTPVSEGCAHCYAAKITKRFGGDFSKVTLHPDRLDMPLHWRKPRMVFVPSMGDLFWEDVPDEFISHVFAVASMCPQHTFQILTKRPERMCAYLAEMSSNPDAYVWVWAHEASNVFLDGAPAPPPVERWPLPNVWLGVSVENQARADERIPFLMDTPAAVRFVSAEPLLGPLDLDAYLWADEWHRENWSGGAYKGQKHQHRREPSLDWVICGGESGGPPERRLVERVQVRCADCRDDPGGIRGGVLLAESKAGTALMAGCKTCHGEGSALDWHPKPEALKWVRSIRDQCQAARVPFFFKQWGPRAGQGTVVDGRKWQEMPEVRA